MDVLFQEITQLGCDEVTVTTVKFIFSYKHILMCFILFIPQQFTNNYMHVFFMNLLKNGTFRSVYLKLSCYQETAKCQLFCPGDFFNVIKKTLT